MACLARHIPIAPLLPGAILLPQQQVPGFELANSFERRIRGGNVAKSEIRLDRAPIEAVFNEANLEERLQLGSENDLRVGSRHIQRLDAESIAREQQPTLARVPQRKCKHAA